MAEEQINNMRRSEVYSGLNKPRLLMGCDRGLLIFSLLIAVVCVVLFRTWVTFFFGIGFGLFALFALKEAAKADPIMKQFYMRQLKYKKYYHASSREDNK